MKAKEKIYNIYIDIRIQSSCGQICFYLGSGLEIRYFLINHFHFSYLYYYAVLAMSV